MSSHPPNSVNVQPKEYITTNIASKVSFQITEMVLTQSITLLCQIINDQNVPFFTTTFKIENEEYANWVNTDDYIINLILKKLYLQKFE